MPYRHTFECANCKYQHTIQNAIVNYMPPSRTLHDEMAPNTYGINGGGRCFGIMWWLKSEQIAPPAPAPTPIGTLAQNYYNSLGVKPAMICAARMRVHPYAIRYGQSAHGIPRANLAGNLGNQLPANGATIQGWTPENCAEVQAAHLILYDQGLQFGQTGGIEFYAIDATNNHRPPCLNCSGWVNRI